MHIYPFLFVASFSPSLALPMRKRAWDHGLGRRERSLEDLGDSSRWQSAACCILEEAVKVRKVSYFRVFLGERDNESEKGKWPENQARGVRWLHYFWNPSPLVLVLVSYRWPHSSDPRWIEV